MTLLLAAVHARYYSSFGHTVAHAATWAVVGGLIRMIFRALGPWGSLAVGALILLVVMRYLRRR